MNITAKERTEEIIASSATLKFDSYAEAKEFALVWSRKTLRGHAGPSADSLTVTVYDLSQSELDYLNGICGSKETEAMSDAELLEELGV